MDIGSVRKQLSIYNGNAQPTSVRTCAPWGPQCLDPLIGNEFHSQPENGLSALCRKTDAKGRSKTPQYFHLLDPSLHKDSIYS